MADSNYIRNPVDRMFRLNCLVLINIVICPTTYIYTTMNRLISNSCVKIIASFRQTYERARRFRQLEGNRDIDNKLPKVLKAVAL